MRMVPDKTKRFKLRPHFDPDELDIACEAIIEGFLQEKYGGIKFPISTSDIQEAISQHTSSLKTNVDLSNEGKFVDGMTEFIIGEKPKIYISDRLDSWHYENRMRTTLTHEFGHVIFHAQLWETMNLDKTAIRNVHRSDRDNILKAKKSDWLEWQAGYASGAFLMPISYVKDLVSQVHELLKSNDCISVSSNEGHALICRVMRRFSVSREAAKVRLSQLGFIKY